MESKKSITGKHLYLGMLFISLSFLPGCGPLNWIKDTFGGNNKNEKSTTSSQPSDTGDALVQEGTELATMEGERIISEASLERDFEQLLEEHPQLKSVLPFMPDAKYNFFQGMVSQSIVDKYVADKGIDQTDAYQKEFEQMTKSIRRMLNTKYFGLEHPVQVADADIKIFYEKNKTTNPQLIVSHGGVKASGVSFNSKEDADAFASKVSEGSLTTAAKESGLTDKVEDFKFVNESSFQVDPAVRTKLLAMKKFPSTSVVKADEKTFWVVSATESQKPTYRPFEQVKEELAQHLEKEKRMEIFEKEIDTLKTQYNVVVNENFFAEKLEEQRVAQEAQIKAMQESAQLADATETAPAAPATRTA